jgi:hypothetical protein
MRKQVLGAEKLQFGFPRNSEWADLWNEPAEELKCDKLSEGLRSIYKEPASPLHLT